MNSKKFLLLLSIALVIIYIFPLALGFISLKGVLYLSFPIISFIIFPRAFFNKQTFWILISVFFWIVLLLIRNDMQQLLWLQTFIFSWLNCLALSNLFIYKLNVLNLNIFGKTIFWIVLFSIFLSIPIVYNNPMMIRGVITDANRNEIGAKEVFISMQRKGMVDYAFIHAIPSIFPLLFLLMKKETTLKYKYCYIFLIILIYYFILRTSFGTVIIISTILLLLCAITSENMKKNILRYSIIGIITLPFLSVDFIVKLFSMVIPFFEGTIMADKLTDIVFSITTDTRIGQLETRGDLYDMSLQSFLNSPVWGGKGVIGRHSMLIDFLGMFGLLGTVPLILFLYYILKNAYMKINYNFRIFFIFSILPYIILSLFKGTSGFTQLFFISVFIPALLIELTKKTKNKIKNV